MKFTVLASALVFAHTVMAQSDVSAVASSILSDASSGLAEASSVLSADAGSVTVIEG